MYRSQNGGCHATGAGARERAFISSGQCGVCTLCSGDTPTQVTPGDHSPLTRGCTVGIQGERWPYGALWELWRWLSRCTVGIFAHCALWHVTMALIAEQHVAPVWLQWRDVVICLQRQINIVIGTFWCILLHSNIINIIISNKQFIHLFATLYLSKHEEFIPFLIP